jgi:hypothetical protein
MTQEEKMVYAAAFATHGGTEAYYAVRRLRGADASESYESAPVAAPAMRDEFLGAATPQPSNVEAIVSKAIDDLHRLYQSDVNLHTGINPAVAEQAAAKVSAIEAIDVRIEHMLGRPLRRAP